MLNTTVIKKKEITFIIIGNNIMNYTFDLDLDLDLETTTPVRTAQDTINDIRALGLPKSKIQPKVRGLVKLIAEYTEANAVSKKNSNNSKKYKRNANFFNTVSERISEIHKRHESEFDAVYWNQVAINYLGSVAGRPKNIDYKAYATQTYNI